MKDDYTQLETDQYIENCPVCRSKAQLWQYVNKDGVVERLVACTHSEVIGPQNGLVNEGCLLYMPPEAFYQPTARAAISYWNAFSVALVELRKGQ